VRPKGKGKKKGKRGWEKRNKKEKIQIKRQKNQGRRREKEERKVKEGIGKRTGKNIREWEIWEESRLDKMGEQAVVSGGKRGEERGRKGNEEGEGRTGVKKVKKGGE